MAYISGFTEELMDSSHANTAHTIDLDVTLLTDKEFIQNGIQQAR